MKIAVYEYKCRRCGDIFDGCETAEKNANSYLIYLLINGKNIPKTGVSILKIGTHICDISNNSCGVGDLIGYRVEEQI